MTTISPAQIEVELHLPQQLIAEALSTLLPSSGGIRVVATESEQVASCRVVVADYKLALEALESKTPANRRIVVLSASTREAEVQRSMQAGVHGFLALTSPMSELSHCIRVVARGHRYVCQEAAQSIATGFGRMELTRREQEVLDLMATGLGNKSIAKELRVAPGTIKTHVKAILGKLDAVTRTHAASVARERGLVPG